MRGIGFEARCSASTAHRPRSMDVARRIIGRDRRSGTAFKSGSRFGPPSPCNSARLGICEFVSLQRLLWWVADANHAASSDGILERHFGVERALPKGSSGMQCNGNEAIAG